MNHWNYINLVQEWLLSPLYCNCLLFPSSLFFFLLQYWTDIYLSWNPESYPGVQNLRFPSNLVWVPDILLYNRWDPSPTPPSAQSTCSKAEHCSVNMRIPLSWRFHCWLAKFAQVLRRASGCKWNTLISFDPTCNFLKCHQHSKAYSGLTWPITFAERQIKTFSFFFFKWVLICLGYFFFCSRVADGSDDIGI